MNEALAERLARQTGGEVLFDAASRGRYATDASIYQIMPLGVFVPKTAGDVATAIEIARELKVPLLPRGGGTSQCGQTTGAALVIDFSKHLRRVISLDLANAHRAGRARHRARPPERAAEAARAVVPGRRVDQRAGHARRHGRQQLLRQPLASPTATWCTTSPASTPGWPTAAASRSARSHRSAPTERAIADFVRGLADTLAPEIDAHWPKVMRRVAGYNLDIFRPRSERPYTGDGSVNLAHLLVGAEGTLAVTRSLDAAAQPAAARQGAGRRQLPELPRRDGVGAAHRQARRRRRSNWSTAR